MGINDTNGQLQLRVIELRSQSYPELVPWPLLATITLPLALLQIDTEKSQLESDYLKIKLFSQSDDNDLSDERQCLIKMFAVTSLLLSSLLFIDLLFRGFSCRVSPIENIEPLRFVN